MTPIVEPLDPDTEPELAQRVTANLSRLFARVHERMATDNERMATDELNTRKSA